METSNYSSRNWDGFNNIGVCITAIGCVLNHVKTLSLPKVLLIMPFVMHESTLRFLAKANVRERRMAAFVSTNPELAANFDERYQQSIVLTLNAIQFLIASGYARYNGDLEAARDFIVDESFGKRAALIERASKNIVALLDGNSSELYLNLRVKL